MNKDGSEGAYITLTEVRELAEAGIDPRRVIRLFVDVMKEYPRGTLTVQEGVALAFERYQAGGPDGYANERTN